MSTGYLTDKPNIYPYATYEALYKWASVYLFITWCPLLKQKHILAFFQFIQYTREEANCPTSESLLTFFPLTVRSTTLTPPPNNFYISFCLNAVSAQKYSHCPFLGQGCSASAPLTFRSDDSMVWRAFLCTQASNH